MFTKNSLKEDYGKNFEEFMLSDFIKDSDITPRKDKAKIKNFWNDDDDSSSSHQIGTGKSFLKSSTRPAMNNDNKNDKISENVHSDDKSISDLRLNLNESSDKSHSTSNINYDAPTNDAGYAHPMTFEGVTDTHLERPYSPSVDSQSRPRTQRPNTGIDTIKSNVSTIPMDRSGDNFQRSLDKTDKEHLLSKVSLMESYDEQRLNASGHRVKDSDSTGGFPFNSNKLNRTGDSYKNSLNPASGDSFNYTQAITNVTDTVIGDTTAADLEAIHRHYEKYTNKKSDDFTPESNIPMSETMKEICEERFLDDDRDFDDVNMDSTIHSKSFGLKVIQPESNPSPTPTPRPRNINKISVSDNSEVSTRKDDAIISTTNKKIDGDYKSQSTRYSHVKSSGYGSKSITPQKNSVSPTSKSQSMSARGKTNHQSVNTPAKINNPPSNRSEHRPAKSRDHSRSKSAPRFDDKDNNYLSQPKNETYYIRRNSDERNIKDVNHVNSNDSFNRRNKEWEEKWLEERKFVKKLQADSVIQEKDFQRQLDSVSKRYEERISQLEIQLTRHKQMKSDLGNKLLGPTVTKEDIARVEQEMKEQSSILVAYEKDNERLCQEIKILKKQKKGEDKVDSIENGRLISQIVSLQAELDSKEIELRNLKQIAKENLILKNNGKIENKEFFLQEIAGLKIELQNLNSRYLQSESDKQKAEMKLDKTTIEFEKKIQQQRNEIEIEQVEREKLKEAHKNEVDDLKRKIKWYLENQAIIDQNSKKLKIKDKEIYDLKQQLESSNTIKISSNIRAKEKLADTIKIRQLEDEVMALKEDLHSLVKGKNIGNVAEKRTIQFLEDKIKSLESDSDKVANKENIALRSLRQQFEAMKCQYEEKISDLEFDLIKNVDNKTHSEKHTRISDLRSKVEELNQELVKKSAHINRLQMDIKKINKTNNENSDNPKKPKNIRKVEIDNNRIEILRNQLQEKDLEIQRLMIQNSYLKTNERKECDNNLPYRFVPGQLELEAENAKYKSQIVHLTRDIENYRQALEEIKSSTIHHDEMIRDESRKELKKLEEYHRENLNNLKMDYANRHSESDTANLRSQIEIQKTYINHLQNQITDFNIKLRNSESKTDELTEAKEQIQTLKTELSDLRLIWSKKPGLEMIDRLRSKIVQLEEKETLKGKQLDEYVDKLVKSNTKQYQDEVERWRGIVFKKNQNLLRVQHELNQLLESLEELRRQGITIPKLSGIKLH